MNKYLVHPFIILAVILVFSIYQTNRGIKQDIRGKADEMPEVCKNECIGKDRCGKGPVGDIYDDPCCKEIERTGDPGECSWPQRGYCTPGQCGSIPEGVRKLGCGGPRQSWCGICTSNNCPGYGSSPVQPTAAPTSIPVIPTEIILPTSVPIPTEIILQPTEQPYPTEVIQPTQIIEPPSTRPQITYVPIIIPPYTPPTVTPTTVPFKFNLPNILPAKEKVQSFWEGIRLNLLDFFSKILP